MKKLLAILMALALVVCCFAACGDKTAKDPDNGDNTAATPLTIDNNVIKIGVFEPATGENGAGGMQEVLGIRYANSVAPSVTIDGTEYKIELVEVDNQSDKAAAVTAASQLVSSNVVAVLGSYGSGVSIAAGETFKENKISVSDHIKAVAKELGGTIEVVKYVRMEKGEGIEKKADDFAAEVAAAAGLK